MLGIEPNLRWQTFAGMVIELAARSRRELMVTLGSLLADVPHTRPSPVTGGATDPELIERLGLQRSRYEGPTGVVGVLHDACSGAERSVGQPLGGGAALRLARAEPARGACALPAPRRHPRHDDRHRRARGGVRALQRAGERGASPPTRRLPPTLPSSSSARRSSRTEEDLPSGETLAAELTRFLRERERGNGGPEREGPTEQP